MKTETTKTPSASDKVDELVRSRPTRRDLLIVLGQLQTIFGEAKGVSNDRNPNREHDLQAKLQEGFDLCLGARNFDPPMDGKRSRNGWGE
jgi:hypothetical protein